MHRSQTSMSHTSMRSKLAATELFETTDFYLACYLRCVGYDMADVRREGRRSIFVFHDRPGRRAEILAFYNSESLVRPLVFIQAVKHMKALIHHV